MDWRDPALGERRVGVRAIDEASDVTMAGLDLKRFGFCDRASRRFKMTSQMSC